MDDQWSSSGNAHHPSHGSHHSNRSLCVGIRKKTLRGASGALGGAGSARRRATTDGGASSSSSSPAPAAARLPRPALALQHLGLLVGQDGGMAHREQDAALAPNFSVLGETTVVFTTTRDDLAETRHDLHVHQRPSRDEDRAQKPPVTLGSSQLKRRGAFEPAATSSRIDCDSVIIANTSSICFCNAAADERFPAEGFLRRLRLRLLRRRLLRDALPPKKLLLVSFPSRSSAERAARAFLLLLRRRRRLFLRAAASRAPSSPAPPPRWAAGRARLAEPLVRLRAITTRWYRPGNCAATTWRWRARQWARTCWGSTPGTRSSTASR